MPEGDDKILSRSGSVEVVADQTDDGSYEIRVHRHDEEDDSSTVLRREAAAASAASAASTVASVARDRRLLVGAGIGVLVIGGAVAVVAGLGDNGLHEPATIEVSEQPRFRGYMVSGGAVEPASVRLRDTGEQVDPELPDLADEQAQPASAGSALDDEQRELHDDVRRQLEQIIAAQNERREADRRAYEPQGGAAEDEVIDDELLDEDELYDDELLDEDELLDDEY